MNRRLIVMRHGHAEDGSDDFLRALTPPGESAARRAGQKLAERQLGVDHVIASSALRAERTAELVTEALGYAGPINTSRSLYLASLDTLLEALRSLPDGAASVLLVGHNPGLSTLALHLCQHATGLAPAQFVIASRNLDSWKQL